MRMNRKLNHPAAKKSSFPFTAGNLASFLFRAVWLILWCFVFQITPAFQGKERLVWLAIFVGLADGFLIVYWVNAVRASRAVPK